jgi:hypothetical protein
LELSASRASPFRSFQAPVVTSWRRRTMRPMFAHSAAQRPASPEPLNVYQRSPRAQFTACRCGRNRNQFDIDHGKSNRFVIEQTISNRFVIQQAKSNQFAFRLSGLHSD